MRVFIATDINEQIREALGLLQGQLQDKVDLRKGDVKWVNPDNIHLTLKFLGQIDDEAVVEVCNIVKKVVSKHSSFELAVETVGSFGGKSARVLWVGTTQVSDNLAELQSDFEEQLAVAGWPKDSRKFSAHLTLCRIKNSKAGIKLAQVSKEYKDFKLGSIMVDSVSVYQSQLTSDGPIYTILGNYELS